MSEALADAVFREDIHLDEVVDSEELAYMLEHKYVKEQVHPLFPQFRILNYTDAAMWDQIWNDTTMTCRGLIYDAISGEVISRPFRKFFNSDQEQAPTFDIGTELVAYDKVDGSLGISYVLPDGLPRIATRGSFASDQAAWATAHLAGTYPEFKPLDGLTYLWEIVYPENRVVVDYGDVRALVLLGVVDTVTGISLDIRESTYGWTGPVVEALHVGTYADLLALPPRNNAEGFVLWDPETDRRVKVKYDDYKMLHRYLTNTTAKHVWEVLSSGQDPDEIFAAAPDEFHVWLRGVIEDLNVEFDTIKLSAFLESTLILKDLPDDYTRKDFALKAKDSKYSALLFLMLDGREIDSKIWAMIKPSGTPRTVRTVNSDAD